MTSGDTDNGLMSVKNQESWMGCGKKRKKYKPWKRSEPAPVMIPTATQSATVKTVAAFSVTVLLSVPAIDFVKQENAKMKRGEKKAKSQSLVVKRKKTQSVDLLDKSSSSCSHGTRTHTIRLENEHPQPKCTS